MVSVAAMVLGIMPALVALLPALTHAAPLNLNPTMSVGDVVELDHAHPGFGAAIRDLKNFTDNDAAATNSTVPVPAARQLEATTNNIQRLEPHFDQPMERNLHKLALKAEVSPAPWPSNYWPVYADGINAGMDRTQVLPRSTPAGLAYISALLE